MSRFFFSETGGSSGAAGGAAEEVAAVPILETRGGAAVRMNGVVAQRLADGGCWRLAETALTGAVSGAGAGAETKVEAWDRFTEQFVFPGAPSGGGGGGVGDAVNRALAVNTPGAMQAETGLLGGTTYVPVSQVNRDAADAAAAMAVAGAVVGKVGSALKGKQTAHHAERFGKLGIETVATTVFGRRPYLQALKALREAGTGAGGKSWARRYYEYMRDSGDKGGEGFVTGFKEFLAGLEKTLPGGAPAEETADNAILFRMWEKAKNKKKYSLQVDIERRLNGELLWFFKDWPDMRVGETKAFEKRPEEFKQWYNELKW